MAVEKLTFLYIYICLCIILFTILFSIYVKWQSKVSKKHKQVLRELLTVPSGDQEVQQHLKQQLLNKLKKIAYLTAFHETLLELEGEKVHVDWMMLGEVMSELAYQHPYRQVEKKAYFAHVIYFLDLNQRMKSDTPQAHAMRARLSQCVMAYAWEDSIYIRENALKAIISLGIEEDVLKVLSILDQQEDVCREKVVQDHLLNFTGSHQVLADSLYQNLGKFMPTTQVAIVNYLRLLPKGCIQHEHYWKGFYELLSDEKKDKEIRLALIRYFKKYIYSPVRTTLMQYVQCVDEDKWEFAVVAAMSLEGYEGEEEKDVLVQALTSSNWYLRLNAAESLVNKGYSYQEIAGNRLDDYATDMIAYRIQIKAMQKRKAIQEIKAMQEGKVVEG
ncbi:MAG: hypothetical protein RSD02_07775 [Niameybacter sp.]